MFLIDGNNLWYAAMLLPEPLNGISRHELVDMLTAYCRHSGEAMTVVLDGYAPADKTARTERGLSRHAESDPCARVFAGARSADDVIVQFVEESTEPRRLTVVSSDRRLVRSVRKRRARAIAANVFARRLAGWLGRSARRKGLAEPAGKQSGLGGSRDSIGHWLKFFQLSAEKSDIISGERAGTRDGDQTGRSTSPSSSSPEVTEPAGASSDSQMRRVFDDVVPLKRRKPRRARRTRARRPP